MFDNFKKRLDEFLAKQPQVRELLAKLQVWWTKFGLAIKVGVGGVVLLVVVMLAIALGRRLAILNRPGEGTPEALPTVAPTVESEKISVFAGLKQQVAVFSVLLPDPAPPAVDANITLSAPKR